MSRTQKNSVNWERMRKRRGVDPDGIQTFDNSGVTLFSVIWTPIKLATIILVITVLFIAFLYALRCKACTAWREEARYASVYNSMSEEDRILASQIAHAILNEDYYVVIADKPIEPEVWFAITWKSLVVTLLLSFYATLSVSSFLFYMGKKDHYYRYYFFYADFPFERKRDRIIFVLLTLPFFPVYLRSWQNMRRWEAAMAERKRGRDDVIEVDMAESLVYQDKYITSYSYISFCKERSQQLYDQSVSDARGETDEAIEALDRAKQSLAECQSYFDAALEKQNYLRNSGPRCSFHISEDYANEQTEISRLRGVTRIEVLPDHAHNKILKISYKVYYPYGGEVYYIGDFDFNVALDSCAFLCRRQADGCRLQSAAYAAPDYTDSRECFQFGEIGRQAITDCLAEEDILGAARIVSEALHTIRPEHQSQIPFRFCRVVYHE